MNDGRETCPMTGGYCVYRADLLDLTETIEGLKVGVGESDEAAVSDLEDRVTRALTDDVDCVAPICGLADVANEIYEQSCALGRSMLSQAAWPER